MLINPREQSTIKSDKSTIKLAMFFEYLISQKSIKYIFLAS